MTTYLENGYEYRKKYTIIVNNEKYVVENITENSFIL